MIRINLLGIKREKSRTRMPSVSMEGAKATILFAIIVAAAVGLLGFHYTYLDRQKAELEKQQADAKKEKASLEAVKREVETLEKKKQAYQKKIAIIEKLKENQTGPVTMLNALVATVESSGTLWLTSFTNDGNKISLNGIAGNVNTVADFITNLKRSGYFKNVEISEANEDESRAVSTFVFSITAEIAPPETQSGAPPASGAPATAAKS